MQPKQNKLTVRDQLEKTHKSLNSQYRVLSEENAIPTTKKYFKTLIPQLTYCISVWRNRSVIRLYEIENLHIKVGRSIHRVPLNVLAENEAMSDIKRQDLGYLYKRRLDIEVLRAKQGLNHRLLSFFRHSGVLLEVKRKKTELGRNSFSYRGTVVWNFTGQSDKEYGLARCFESNTGM